MRIAILIPCHNEEKCIKRTVESCLWQTRPADEMMVVDDASTDRTVQILREFGVKIKLVLLKKKRGNKSFVQQYGLAQMDSEVFVATDADTILDKHFLRRVEENFSDERVVAMSGYVRSLRHNWLTAIREIEYIVGQEVHKRAQANINFLMVIPGCAGAFRTNFFKENIQFDHDTVTEDLDFTYKINEMDIKIAFDRKAVVYTQDPADIYSYINQMRRWYGGGWQNLMKHIGVARKPIRAFEMALSYGEGIFFAFLVFAMPLIDFRFFVFFLASYTVFVLFLGLVAGIIRRRADLFFYSPLMAVLLFINSYIFLEQMLLKVVLRQKDLNWFSPARREQGDLEIR